MRRELWIAALLGLACASERVARPAAYGAFPSSSYDEVFTRALRAFEVRHFDLAMSDRAHGVVVTKQVELQAPCGSESCRSRQVVLVRIFSDGHALVGIVRERWDPVARSWRPPADRADVDAVERDQVGILREIVGAELVLRQAGDDRAPPRGY